MSKLEREFDEIAKRVFRFLDEQRVYEVRVECEDGDHYVIYRPPLEQKDPERIDQLGHYLSHEFRDFIQRNPECVFQALAHLTQKS